MKRILFSLFALFVFGLNSGWTQTQLVIRPDGHKVQVRDVCVSKDGKTLYTGDFDKTIIAWDTKTGTPIREYLGKIGPGNEGMVYAIALSPDEKILAAGGWFGKDDESENLGDVRLFSVETGKMIRVLKGHANVIYDLAFTPDGKGLIALDADGRITLWNAAGGNVLREFVGVKESTPMNVFVRGNQFVTGDDLGNFLLWSFENSKPMKKDGFYKGYQIRDVAISPDGKWYACSGERFVSVYNEKFKRVADIDNKFVASFLRFSPDSRLLLTGCTTSGKEHQCKVYALENEKWELYGSFDQHQGSVICGDFLDAATMVTAGGEDNEICIWTIPSKGAKAKLIRKMVGVGKSFYAASINDKQIAFADTWSENFGMSKFTGVFDLVARKEIKGEIKENWNRPQTQSGEWKLHRKRTGSELEDLNAKLEIVRNGKTVDSIVREYWNGSRHNVFGFLPQGWIVSGGSYGMISAYDKTGNEVSRFVSHEGDVWGMSVSADEKRMITASSDQTLRIWPLDEVGKSLTPKNLPSPAEYCDHLEVGPTFRKVFQLLKVEDAASRRNVEDWKKVIETLHRNGYSCQFLENKLSEETRNTIYPLLSLFMAKNGEWVIWNQKGYFTSSRKGARYVGYHVNQGKDKEAKYYPFEQFDLKYNRPDIILKDLGHVSPDLIEGYYLAYQKRLRKMGVKEESLGEQIHLPEVEITNHQVFSESGNVKISFKATDTEFRIERYLVSINDVPVFGAKGRKWNDADGRMEIELPLISGRNKIQISVLNNRGAESLRETMVLHHAHNKLPELYLLSVGVSEYQDKKFNLRYAAKDATDLAELAGNSKAFSAVKNLVLTNEKVSLASLEDARKNFLSKAKPEDVVIVFVAGHGVLDAELNYYFASYAMNFSDPSKNGIPYEKLEELLDGLPALRKVLLMDTCHSGELDKEENESATALVVQQGDVSFRSSGNVAVRRKGFGMSQAAQLATELFTDLRKGTGALVISSAGGAEYAMESSQWKNGLFTYVLMSGIRDATADWNGDGEIGIGELQYYVSEKVMQLSGGAQQPSFRRENLEFDVRVW